MGGIN